MRLKDDTVKIQGISPELLFGLNVADKVYENHDQELVITSLNDGEHSLTSLHYSGNAGDLRTYYFVSKVIVIVKNEIKERLGNDYDVVIEEDHMHLEFQPKRPLIIK